MLSAGYLFGFPETSRGQMAKKGLIKTKLSPYFTSLEGGEIQCELCPTDAAWRRGKGAFAGCGKTGMGNITAWSMEILARFI